MDSKKDNNSSDLSFVGTIGFAMLMSGVSVAYTLLFAHGYGFEIPDRITAVLLLGIISGLLVIGTVALVWGMPKREMK